MALTTLSEVKAILGITSTDYDTILTNYINASSTAIENYCDRKFEDQDHIALIDAKDYKLILKNRPVNAVKFVGYGSENAISITNGNSVPVTFEIFHDKLAYTPTDTLTTTEFAFATYTTFTTLEAQLEALTGITSSVVNDGATKLSYEGVITLDAGETAYIEKVAEVAHIAQLSDGFYATESADAHLIIYNGGWVTIPADITEVCNKIVCALYNTKTSFTFNSETIGDYSYSRGSFGGNGSATDPIMMLTMTYSDVLDSYKNLVI